MSTIDPPSRYSAPRAAARETPRAGASKESKERSGHHHHHHRTRLVLGGWPHLRSASRRSARRVQRHGPRAAAGSGRGGVTEHHGGDRRPASLRNTRPCAPAPLHSASSSRGGWQRGRIEPGVSSPHAPEHGGGGCWGAGAGPRAPTKLTMLGWDPIDAITDTCAQKAAPPASARGGARSARARLRAPSGACGRPRRGVCAGVCGGARLSDDVLDRTVHCARVLCQVVAHALHLRRPVAPRRASARRRSAHTARAAGAAVWRSAAGCDGARGGTELRPRRGALPVFRYPGARWRLHWSPGRANSPPQGGPCSSWFPGTLIPLTPARTRCGYPALLRPEGVVQVAERCAAQHLANHFSATVDLVRA